LTRPPIGDQPPEDFRRLAHEVSDWIADYLADVGDLPVYPSVRPGDIRDRLAPSAPEIGEPLDAALEDYRDIIVPGLTHWNHPAFLAYFSITGSGPGILGEMLAAGLNVNAMVWRSSPAATELEEVTLDWLRQLVGLPESFDGVINDTASSSGLYALAAAREVAYPEVHREGLFGQPVGRVYASDQTHSSIEKAVLTLGLGESGYRALETDEAYRMRPDVLRRALKEDIAEGIRPVAVVSTLGTTSTGSVDPVGDIADVCEEFGLWHHVDAAYGGPAAIVPECRHLFRGWERADSVVVNPHKWLFTPVDCSVLYCRRPEQLIRAFSIVPEYLRTTETGEARNLMDYGVSLGRRFRSLKLWFVLRYFGRQGIIDNIRHHISLAQELADWVDEAPQWQRMAPVELALTCLRYAPEGMPAEDLDAMNQRILDRVNSTGRAFLTHTKLDGRFTIRVTVGNLKTTRERVEEVWSLLKRASEGLPGHHAGGGPGTSSRPPPGSHRSPSSRNPSGG
jgi:aromatic-L-amino-acid decarboxylase